MPQQRPQLDLNESVRNGRELPLADSFTTLAEQSLHARPTSDQEARNALEWVAAREGKTLTELVREIHGASRLAGRGLA